MAWRKSWTFGAPLRDLLRISPSDSNASVLAKFASFLTKNVEDTSGLLSPDSFLTLKHDAYSRADPYKARRGSCESDYDAGHYHTEVKWTKLKWLNKELMQIDASDTTHATIVAPGTAVAAAAADERQPAQASRLAVAFATAAFSVASARDCAGPQSARGEGLIDLRGTPYMIANVDDTSCWKTCPGKCSRTVTSCFQWIASGYDTGMEVSCYDNNQRCVIRCGGSAGSCSPRDNTLQLALAPINLADFAPADDETVGVWDNSPADFVFFKPYPNNGQVGARGSGDATSAFPITITAPQSGIYQVRLSQASGAQFSRDTKCSSKQMTSDLTDSFFICSSDPRSKAENPGPNYPRPGTSDLSSCSIYMRENTITITEHNSGTKSRPNTFGNAQMHTFPLSAGTNTLWLASREVCAIADQIKISLIFSRVVALADYAPWSNTVKWRTGDDGAREVFFMPVPNDGTLNNMGNGEGASAFQITVMVPQSGEYQVRLTQRRGSDKFENKAGSACRSNKMGASDTDSFFICSSDPRSTATNPDPGTPDLSSCKAYHYLHSPQTFSFSDGANSLWLASREVCALASKITITAI